MHKIKKHSLKLKHTRILSQTTYFIFKCLCLQPKERQRCHFYSTWGVHSVADGRLSSAETQYCEYDGTSLSRVTEEDHNGICGGEDELQCSGSGDVVSPNFKDGMNARARGKTDEVYNGQRRADGATPHMKIIHVSYKTSSQPLRSDGNSSRVTNYSNSSQLTTG